MGLTPLRISTIRPNAALTFDLYIFFKDQYLLYQKSGEEIGQEKLKKLRKQKFAKFYLTEKDEPLYQSYLEKILAESLEDSSISSEEKIDLSSGACETAFEKMQADPASEVSYRMASSSASNLRKTVSQNPEALKKLFLRPVEDSDLLVKHSLNVCAFTTKLGLAQGLSEERLDRIATAALLHDLGVSQIENGIELFKKTKKDLSPTERKLYEAHTKETAHFLAEKPFAGREVCELILNHEETLSGSGPQKKKKLSIDEEIISLVNTFDKKRIVENISAAEAIKMVSIDELGNYQLDLIKNFKEILKREGILD